MLKTALPLGTDEFAHILKNMSGFESAPVVAVGVSGGADSMALVALLDIWTRSLGGYVVGLTVDHGLRAESGAEARQAGVWLKARGIEHHILPWIGEKPTTAIQARARVVRRNLLLDWCKRAGVLHLALAHHGDDQAETYMMRLAKGSGPDGLAGMAAIKEHAQARILRPLLGVGKDRLISTLQAMQQDWIEDPSNAMDRFERVRVRQSLAAMNDSGATGQRISRVMEEHARSRQELDQVCARILARSVTLHAAGFARVNAAILCAEGDLLGARCLARLLIVIGGREYGAEKDKLFRAYERLKTGDIARGLTLAGCRIVKTGDGYLVCRENRNLPAKFDLESGMVSHWDNRFLIKAGHMAGEPLALAALGEGGWREIVNNSPDFRDANKAIPTAVGYSLPALYRDGRVLHVPQLGYGASSLEKSTFYPREPVLGANFVSL